MLARKYLIHLYLIAKNICKATYIYNTFLQIPEGAAVPLNTLMAYAQFPSTEIDGYNPYRLAKETMADFQIGFVMTKGMPWNEQIDKALQNIIEAG